MAYDSEVLSRGGTPMTMKLTSLTELRQLGEGVTASLPASVQEVRVHIFLIPVEKLALQDQFAENLGLS